MAGSLFDVHRAEPSQQQSMATQPLDKQQAESSRQHVRALNTQFASWVQTQLKNHPDELWEDGVGDYLAHASNIMEKFSDVVDWLKANALKVGNASASEPRTTEKDLASEIKNNDIKLYQEKTFTPATKTTSFATSGSSGLFSSSSALGSSGLFSNNAASSGSSGLFSNNAASGSSGLFSSNATSRSSGLFSTSAAPSRSSGLFSNSAASGSSGLFSNNTASGSSGLFSSNAASGSFGLLSNNVTSGSSGGFSNSQTPTLFGNQSSLPKINNASNADDEDELPQPSSPSVKKTEEKGIIVVHEVKCKLYVKSTDPADKDAWKDKGTGRLSIKCKEGVSKGTKDSKPTILVRNDVGRVLLNALLYPGIKTNLQKNSLVAIFHTSADDAGAGDNSSVVARTFLIRTKAEEDRNKLAAAIKEYAPES
ncbi:Pleckstrin domain superfamily protein isoform 1 [Melia azedarach]|nr:Pleckstrin domain superfamily protein isoform 1 [Melia azedarach]